MPYFPLNMQLFARRLAGYSRRDVKLQPQQTTCGPSQTIVINLPENTLIDLDQLAIFYKVTTDSTAGKHTRISGNVDAAIFDKVELVAGGVTIGNSFNNYNLVHKLLYAGRTSSDKHHSRTLTAGSTVSSSDPTEEITGDQYFCANDFIGPIGSIEPRIISTELFPSLQIRLTLAAAHECCFTDHATDNVGATYALSDIFATISTLDVSDNLYNQMLQQKLAEGQPLEIPYKSYYTYTGSKAASSGGSFNMTCSSRSIDRIFVAPRSTSTVPTTNTQGCCLRQCFDKAGIQGYQFQVNNVQVPAYKIDNRLDMLVKAKQVHGIDKDATAGDMLNLFFGSTLNVGSATYAAAGGGYANENSGYTPWTTQHWHAAVSLEHLGVEENARLTSGYNSQGGSSRVTFNYDGAGAVTGYDGALFESTSELVGIIECTQMLLIHGGRQIEIVN